MIAQFTQVTNLSRDTYSKGRSVPRIGLSVPWVSVDGVKINEGRLTNRVHETSVDGNFGENKTSV